MSDIKYNVPCAPAPLPQEPEIELKKMASVSREKNESDFRYDPVLGVAPFWGDDD